MKKLMSVLLAAVMLAAMLMPAFAAHADECGVTPVISVRGFGSDLYVQNDDGSETGVFSYNPAEISAMVTSVSGALARLALRSDYSGFVDKLRDAVDVLAAGLKCDENGASVKNVVTHSDPTDTDTHLNTDYAYFHRDKEHGNYVFEYDWRMSPIAIADELNEYVQQVKAATGHDKVALISHSEGNSITASYLNKYGAGDIEKSVHLSAAFQGISIIGEAFTKNVDLENKGRGLQDFLTTFLDTDSFFGFLNSLVASLNNMGVLDRVLNGLDKVFDKTLDQVYSEILVDTFATMPAMWSFVPDEYYEEAKQTMLGGDEKYAGLIRQIDDYHDNVQTRVPEILQQTMDAGTPVAIICGYGIAVIPVTTVTDSQGDMLIDTKYASVGATAAPFGGMLESGERLSPDAQIDAATCAFPEITWFVKYQSHNSFTQPYKDFVLWLIQYDGQPTVTSNEAYPQFMLGGSEAPLRPVTGADRRVSTGLLRSLLTRLMQIFQRLFGGFAIRLPEVSC